MAEWLRALTVLPKEMFEVMDTPIMRIPGMLNVWFFESFFVFLFGIGRLLTEQKEIFPSSTPQKELSGIY